MSHDLHTPDPNHSNSLLYWVTYFLFCGLADLCGFMQLALVYALPKHSFAYFPQLDELVPKMIIGVILAVLAFFVSELLKYLKAKITGQK